MPTNVVDLSAVSEIIRDEPWHLHFWELTPREYGEQMRDPRGFIAKMGIEIPEHCTILTEFLNHDWAARRTSGFAADDGVLICNVGGGNVAVAAYKITSYAHAKEDVGKHRKKLLHAPTEKKVAGT
jgi:hypothetical protein